MHTYSYTDIETDMAHILHIYVGLRLAPVNAEHISQSINELPAVQGTRMTQSLL